MSGRRRALICWATAETHFGGEAGNRRPDTKHRDDRDPVTQKQRQSTRNCRRMNHFRRRRGSSSVLPLLGSRCRHIPKLDINNTCTIMLNKHCRLSNIKKNKKIMLLTRKADIMRSRGELKVQGGRACGTGCDMKRDRRPERAQETAEIRRSVGLLAGSGGGFWTRIRLANNIAFA